MIWKIRKNGDAFFEEGLATRLLLTFNLKQSQIYREDDSIRIEFGDDPYKGFIFQAKLKVIDGEKKTLGYLHRFNLIFTSISIFASMMLIVGLIVEPIEKSIYWFFAIAFLLSLNYLRDRSIVKELFVILNDPITQR